MTNSKDRIKKSSPQNISLINSIIPVLMGIFTLWFQKWYPAKRAKG